MPLIAQVLVGLLASYVQRLATQEFADYVLRKIAKAIVASTATKQDDDALAAIEAFIDGKKPQA